jgi:D-alanine-D-alanine ligase-like ATP-grasp enzyme
MRIGVTCDAGPNEERDLVARALAPLGDPLLLPADDSLPQRLREHRPAIVLNLARGGGSAPPERRLHVPALLEYLAIPFSGSDAITHATCIARPRLKATLAAHGIPTSGFAVVESPAQLAPFARRAFPVAVRRARGVDSCFATLVAHDFDELASIAAALLETSREPILIERFLPGDSFACSVLGNGDHAIALPLVALPNDPFASIAIVSPSSASPVDSAPTVPSPMATGATDQRPASGPAGRSMARAARIDDGLAEEIETLALRTVRALGCRDLARVDVRLSDAGVPNVCSVEPLPPFVDSDGGATRSAAQAAGLAAEELVQRCLVLAAERAGVGLPHPPRFPHLPRRLPAHGRRLGAFPA